MWNHFTAVGNLTLKTVTADKFSLSTGLYPQEDDGDDWPCQCDKDATVNLSAQFLQIFLQESMRQKQKLTIPQLICYSRC